MEKQVQQRTQELATSNEELVAANQQTESVNQHLVRSNQNLEQFAYIASHDLQEPLRKIQSFSDMLKTRYAGSLGEELLYVERMQNAASRMSQLIRDLLAFSRISTGQVVARPVSLTEVLTQTLEDQSIVVDETKARIEFNGLPTVPGDRSQLGQLFFNLLTNALKFSCQDQQGHSAVPQIRIQATRWVRADLPAWVEPVRLAAVYHCIDVKDNGVGFDEKYLDRIFQVFQRLHGKNEFAGTGICLAICEKVVTNNGGGYHGE